MIVCSCNVISENDIRCALMEILGQEGAPLPTPGVVYRHLQKRMSCCGCAPLAVSIIYESMSELEQAGLICPRVGRRMRGQLVRLSQRRAADNGNEKRAAIKMPAAAE